MSENIHYKGRMLGSIHHFVYVQGQLPGNKNDIFLRLNNLESLETITNLQPQEELLVGTENMDYDTFKKDVLEKVRHIHFVDNKIQKGVY